MKRKRVLSLIIVGALCASFVSGCGAKKEEVQPQIPADTGSTVEEVAMTGKTVGISLPDESVLRWSLDGEALKQLFRSQGYEAKVSYAGGSAEQQGRDIDAFVSGSCDLIVVAAADETGLTSSMGRVKEAGIPVISYDRLVRNTDALTAYVAFDDYMVGQLEAQFLLDSLGLKDAETSKVYHIEFAAGDKADLRQGYYYNGAYDVLKPFLDSGALTVTSGENMFSDAVCDVAAANAASAETKNPQVKTAADLAAERMKRILSDAYSDALQLDAVLCTDDAAAAGVIKAVGSEYSGKNQVLITGMGAEDANLALIADGKQKMTVFEPTDLLRNVTVELGISLMKGESPDGTLIEKKGFGEFCRYDTESYDNGMGVIKAYLAYPVVVTADNVQEVLVDSGYYEMSGKSAVRKKTA